MNHPMRIAFVSLMDGSPWGGSEELWAAAAEAALSQGHEVMVSCYDWGEIPPRLQKLTAAGAKLVRRPRELPARTMAGRGLRRLRSTVSTPRPFAAVDAFAPDALLINQGGCFDSVLRSGAADFVKRHGRRVTLTCRYLLDTGVVEDWMRAAACEIYRAVSAVAFASARNRAALERHLCMAMPQSAVIYSPLNPGCYEGPVDFPPDAQDGGARLAAAGRLECGTKGHHLLLQALADDKWKRRPWTLSLYGRGPDEPYVRDLVNYYGLGDRVRFAGHQSSIRAIWQQEQMLVLPSLSEGTPIALMEAMACGRPAVATDVGDTARLVTEGVSGFLAPVALPHYLDASLEAAWAARPRWKEMGATASQTLWQTIDRMPHERLLNLILGRGTGERPAPKAPSGAHAPTAARELAAMGH